MKKYLYGVDLGGTTVKLGLFDFDGKVLEKFEIKTNTSDEGIAILPDIAKAILENMVKNNINKNEVNGIGIGVPGPVSNGVVNRCVNLGWGIVDVKHDLERLTGLNVSVSNDANVAGLGELWQGGGLGYSNLVFFTLGTGVGGAVVVDNKVIDGHVGAGGEIGHAPLMGVNYACNCGKVGCLETVASATGVVRVAKDYLTNTTEQSVLRGLTQVTAKDVFDAAKAGDPIGLKTIDYFGKYLGYICAVVAHTNDPEAFVFGGGVSKAGQIILDVVEKYFNQFAFYALRGNVDFKLATLGNDAGIYGSAYLAKQL